MDQRHLARLSAVLVVLLYPGMVWAASVTIDFSGMSGVSNNTALSNNYTHAGFTFNYDGTDGWYYGATYGVGGSPEIFTDEFNYGDTAVRLKRTDGMEFYFYDVAMRGPFGDTTVNVYGYRDGVQVQGPQAVFCGASFVTETFNWQNVDEIRIEKNGGNEFSFDFDNFRYDDAPTVKEVQVVHWLTVDVTFNKAVTSGQLTATNYTISGTGKGTLANNPVSVVSQGGNTYRLTWTAGGMALGGDVTITVTGVQDSGGQPMGTPNSGTDVGGGLPVELSAFEID